MMPSKTMDQSELSDHVDRDSVVPLYFQLQEILKEKIEIGLWSAGEVVGSRVERYGDTSVGSARQQVPFYGSCSYCSRWRQLATFEEVNGRSTSPPRDRRVRWPP